MAKKPKPFNNPFVGLKLEKPAPAKAAPKPAPRPVAAPEEDEAALFLASVGEVEPVRRGPSSPHQPDPIAPQIRIPDPEAEALDELAELVAGRGPLDLADADEYLEGSAPGLDPRVLKRLRAGEYAPQAHLDLHGLTRVEAKAALERFLLAPQGGPRRGLRCVLVVHGRGLHSKDQIPVLKEGVQMWLSRGPLAARVLAFTSARPADGGVGAVYVLLRR